eukprot:CAMPEP_0202945738 /NCGR_PEP_ID=MMETSP1395-20130829/7224_1 /ASSEMBLY_ACC=CAM_ASM_000871 /TAXON_ID=5961 /ORGANISM="Blepharisma japonicum, Strain Stock R1072" /LENGTH=351 /DNA_ID=CAMNT_0049645965 /DNA_START=221 /DNA_END=1276 /DNA_ORIENTATION=+
MPCSKTRTNAHGFCAAYKAMEDSGFTPSSEEEKEKFGCIMGAGVSSIYETLGGLHDVYINGSNIDAIPADYAENVDINGLTNAVCRYFGAKGHSEAVNPACATGHAVVQGAFRSIMLGENDICVAGAADTIIHPAMLKGFALLGCINTKKNANPEDSSRPLDENREGLAAADGGNAVVLEELQHALARGAKIYGEVKGYSMNCDGFHLTKPTPRGEGIYRTMVDALGMTGMSPEDIDLVLAHATATKAGDSAEVNAIDSVFGDLKPYITAVKGHTGHMMCAVGTFHVISALLMIANGIATPILNMKNPLKINGKELNFVKEPVNAHLNNILINAVGFSGMNNSIIVSRYLP